MALTRYVLYFLGIAACTALLAWTEISSPGALRLHILESPTDSFGTSEYSPVELIQPAILALCLVLFGWVARDCPSQRPIAFALGGLALAFAVRETHYFLDRWIADNFWQVVMAVTLALISVYTYRHRRRFRIAWLRLWPSPGLVLLFAGAIAQLVIAQIFGQEALWMAILGDDYRRVVKLAAEEFMELTGYYFWLIGSLEYAYQARAIAAREPKPASSRRREGRRPKSEGRF